MKTKKNIAIDYYNLGLTYLELENFDKAITSFNKSLEYSPKSYDTIVNIVIAYQKSTKYDLAEKQIVKYYKSNKKEYTKTLLLLLANNFFMQSEFDKALKTYNEYNRLYPDDSDCYFNIGLTYLKLAKPENALDYFKQSHEKKPNHIPSLYNIADYYYHHDDYDNSIVYFNKLLTLEKSNPDIFYRLGEIEFKMEEFNNAKNHLAEAIKLDAENNDYFILLARVYAKGFNDKSNTIANLKKAFENNYRDIRTLNKLPEFKLLSQFEEYTELLKKYKLK